MSKTPTEKQLRKQIVNLNRQLCKMERKNREKDLKKLVGKYYKFKNSYSCPQSEDERWWLYRRVDRIKDGYVTCLEFQRCCDGKINIEVTENYYFNDWQEIQPDEFYCEMDKLLTSINGLYDGKYLGG